ncbi:MAG TPA: hypothetical protein VIQ54_04965 [Polyangia bacterium]|jgi:hypothetical protein
MRGITGLGVVALSVLACRQTVLIDQSGVDGGGFGDGGPQFCTGAPTELLIQFPEVIVALDRSATMNSRFGDSTPLATARAALDTYAARYQKVVEFGYVEFPSSYLCNDGCCASMPSSPNPNYTKFEMALHLCDQNSSPACAPSSYQRPTTRAITSCGVVFASRPDANSRYVLLITNGMPDCGGGGQSSCFDAQMAVNDLAARSFVKTAVVAPGQLDQATSDCLQGMAINGGADYPPYFHPASNQSELTNEIGDIIRDIARDACHVDLGPTRIPDPDGAALYWNNMVVPHDRNNGWDVSGNGFTVNLHGQWCDHLIEDGPADFALFPDCAPRR